jgi:transposase
MGRRKILSGNKEEIIRRMKETSDTGFYRRYQCVLLALENPDMTAEQIGKITLYSTSRVWAIHAEYRKNGLDGLTDGRGGRYHQNMTLEEETKLLEDFKEESESGKLVIIKKIKHAYEAKIGREVAESTIYRMLDRHGFRKIVPYKRHPKNNQEERESFKKTSRT